MKKVEVHWIDSFSKVGWREVDEKDPKMLIQSFGYLVRETDDTVTISTSRTAYDDVCDPLTIPKVAIKNMWEIVV